MSGCGSSLPLGVDFSDPASLADELAATVAAAQDVLTRAALDDSTASALQAASARHTARARPADRDDRPGADRIRDSCRWRNGLRARIEDDHRVVRIVLAGEVIALPAEASVAVHALRDRSTVPTHSQAWIRSPHS